MGRDLRHRESGRHKDPTAGSEEDVVPPARRWRTSIPNSILTDHPDAFDYITRAIVFSSSGLSHLAQLGSRVLPYLSVGDSAR